MRVYKIDSEKQAGQNHAHREVITAEQAVYMLLDKVRGLVSQLNYAVGGTPSGIDQVLIGQCRLVDNYLDLARKQLYIAQDEIDKLEPGEWVEEN